MQLRKALGRGLDSLIPEAEKTTEVPSILLTNEARLGERVKTIPIDSIVPNRLQPRKTFNDESIKELSNSIREQGIIQPLIAATAPNGRYELITGERRLRAARIAGLTEVPVVVKNVDSEEMLEMSLVENVQREDLNPIEETLAYQELMQQFNYTQDEIADKVGKSRVAVANSLRLLKLPKVIQDDVASGRMTAGHARALLAVNDLQLQLKFRERILNAVLTVRDIERMVRNLRPAALKKKEVALTPQFKHVADEMTKVLSTKVSLIPDRERKGGKIIVEYYSPQDLDRIYNVIVR